MAVKAASSAIPVPSPNVNRTTLRGWVRQIARNLGPCLDVPAPDVMTNAKHMLWMMDEFEAIHGGHFPALSPVNPVGMGGSLGRTEATGFGVIFVRAKP